MTISDSINNGNVSGTSYSGGFVGRIKSSANTHSVSLVMTNGANKGSISAADVMTCGLFCIDESPNFNINTAIYNSINKGNVNVKTKGYGITNSATKAHNVVSMGKFTDPDSYSFWLSASEANALFALNSECVNCKDATLFHLTNKGSYEVDGTNEIVADLLNENAKTRGYGMVWTKELELAYSVIVSIGKPIGKKMTIPLGSTVERAAEMIGANISKYVLLNKKTMDVLNANDIIYQDLDIVVYLNVSLQSLATNISCIMEYGTTIEQNKGSIDLPSNCHLVLLGASEEISFEEANITEPTVFVLHHNITVTGKIETTLLVERGTTLGDISMLTRYFDYPNLFEVNDLSNSLIAYSRSEKVLKDLGLVVTEHTTKSSTPAIAASVVCAVVAVVAIVFVITVNIPLSEKA